VVEALDLTPMQKRGLIEILTFMKNGEIEKGGRSLSRHERSGKSWPTRWRSRHEMHQFLEDLQRKNLVSARYGWHIMAWLKRNGWIQDQTRVKGSRTVQGYALSLRALYRMMRSVEKFWEQN